MLPEPWLAPEEIQRRREKTRLRKVAAIRLDPGSRGHVGAMLSVMGSIATILTEIGDAKRFRRARQVVRVAALDRVVTDSAEEQRRGHLSKRGAPCLRWALVEAAARLPPKEPRS
jgi:transposase